MRRIIPLLLVVGFCGFLFFYGLGSFGLVGADEPRYAQIAREMLQRNDWVTPILYGKVWLEKPVLYYWRAMIFFRTLGVSDAAARMPSATLAGLMIVFIYAWNWRFRRGSEVDAALLTASCAMVVAFSRAASTDMSLSAPFTIAMLCWYAWRESQRLHWRWSKAWLSGFYFFVAVATLAKGPVAVVLPAVIIILFALVMREGRLIWKTLWIPGILLFLAVALPWYIAVQMRNPEFLRVFIFEHNLARFGTNLYRHKQPFWYYLPVMLFAVMPWTAIVITAAVGAARELRDRLRSKSESEDAYRVFLLIWAVLPVLFFSISQSKLPGYVLPAVPPCLLLAADWMHRRSNEDSGLPFWLIAVHSALAAFLVAALLLAPSQMLKVPASTTALMLAAGVATVVFVAMAVALTVRGFALLRFATLIPVILCVGFIVRTASPVIDATQSERPVAEKLTSYPRVATFKAKREVEYGLAFYRNQPISVYERLEIPREEHVVVTRPGADADLREILPGRTVTHVGDFPAQKLEFFLVSAR